MDTTHILDLVTIEQTSSNNPPFVEFKIKAVTVYRDPSCVVVSRPNCANATDCSFTIPETGDFIIRTSYDPQTLKNKDVCAGLSSGATPPSSTYTFTALVTVPQQTDMLTVSPKAGELCP